MPVMQAVPTFPTQTLLTRCMNVGNFAGKTGVPFHEWSWSGCLRCTFLELQVLSLCQTVQVFVRCCSSASLQA
jgi:hypothetical protein